jgi:hypothetical protein
MWWNPSPINRVRERAQVQSPWSYVTRDGCDGLVWVVHVVGSAGARIGLGVWDTMSAPECIYIYIYRATLFITFTLRFVTWTDQG